MAEHFNLGTGVYRRDKCRRLCVSPKDMKMQEPNLQKTNGFAVAIFQRCRFTMELVAILMPDASINSSWRHGSKCELWEGWTRNRVLDLHLTEHYRLVFFFASNSKDSCALHAAQKKILNFLATDTLQSDGMYGRSCLRKSLVSKLLTFSDPFWFKTC